MTDSLASLRLEQAEGSLILHLSGEIDLSNARRLEQQLTEAIGHQTSVIVDLAGIEYLDSQRLQLIKHLSDAVATSAARLKVVAPPGSFARQVLELTRMTAYLELIDAL